MFIRRSFIGTALALTLAAAGGCSHDHRTASIDTKSLAQGDYIGRTLLASPASPQTQITSAQAESAPAE